METSQTSTRRRSVVLIALVALLMGLLPTIGVAAAEIEARGTANVCDPPFSSSFDDIAGSAHEDNVLCMADYGITEGTGDGTSYSPRREVTRAQMASFITRYLEHYTGGTLPLGQDRFDDVPPGFVHHDNIHKLLEAGVTDGTAASGGDSFAPQQFVTRGQMASFISRASSFIENGQARPEHEPPRTTTDYFADDDGSIHEANINSLARVGIVEGFTDGTYRPGNPVYRDQMASFVMRAYDWAVAVGLGDGPAGPVDPDPTDPDPDDPVIPDPPPQFDNELTVQLNWQNEYRGDEGAFGGVDDYAAFHLDEGAGEVTFRWTTEDGVVQTEGETTLTSRGTGFHLHTGALDAEGPVAIPLPAPTFVGDAAAEPGTGEFDRGEFTYALDGTVEDADFVAVLEDLDAALAEADGLVDWYLNVHTTHNPAGEVRGQFGDATIVDGGLFALVPLFEYFEFHELGTGTNTGEPQTSFNLWFDADIDYAGDTGQTRPGPADFELTINGEPHPILRVRGNNPDWQPYPKQDIRVHLDTHEAVEDGDIVEITMLDSGAQKLLPVGRNAGADDLSDSWRTRCTVVLSVAAMTSETCGTPPQPGLSGFAATPIDSAPNQEQTFSVTIEEPGIPAGEELWIDLGAVDHDGLVDYSDSTWTATVDGEVVGTAEFWELEIPERFETVWEPFLVFTHTGATPVAGELVLSGSDIDGSDAAVHGEDTAYDTYVVRHDTGRADYSEIVVTYVPQPTITLDPADTVLLAEDGASQTVTATYTDAAGVPVEDAVIRFWVEQGVRPNVVEVELGTGTTDAAGQTTVTYDYDGRAVEVGEPLIDTLRAQLVDDTDPNARFVDAETTVTWATGVATNDGPSDVAGATYHDLNDAVVDAEVGDTITAKGEFTSVYGLPRADRVHVRKADLTLQADAAGASLLGAFDVRASGVTVDGFHVDHVGTMDYAFRVEGADITISNNIIDADGVDGFRVRDAWGPVAGGGSATISGNEIRGAAIGIDVDNRGQATDLITDLTITDNDFVNNTVGIHYNADGGTTTIANNEFEADVSTIVYVRDATAAEALDLEAILAANTFAPAAEILGRSIVPIDPEHVPSMVRVVEHGAGTGNMYSIVEYTRGVACAADGAAVGSQFVLDRGEIQTPNRVGEDVVCNYDGNPSLIRIEWDGNPSFPNTITYTEHADATYRIHNEHELAGGGFTSAASPQTIGGPFTKPDDEAPVYGAVYLHQNDATIDARWFTQGQTIDLVDLRVAIANRSEVPAGGLSLTWEISPPTTEEFTAACGDLLTVGSCTTITAALDANDGFRDNTEFLTDAELEVASDAATGFWQLRFWVVDADTSQQYFSDTYSIRIDAAS